MSAPVVLPLDPLPKECAPAQAGILGHVGVGHVHSVSGIVHDDSVGFAVTLSLMRDALPVDLCVSAVHADPATGWIEVTTAEGGTGRAKARRGITPAQADIMQRAVGRDASLCQSLALHTLGRMYGQGVSEEASAFEAAVAYAAVDSFVRRWPQFVDAVEDTFDDNCDMTLGMRAQWKGLTLALAAVINHTEGGLGPNENNEGSVPYGAGKAALMERLGMLEAPLFMVESKAYIPARCEDLLQRTLITRANRHVDNMVMAQLLCDAGVSAELPILHDFDAYARNDGMLAGQTRALGEAIAALGTAFARASTSRDKVRLIGDLARMTSEDAGGVTFMSDAVHEQMGSGGMAPGSGAMLSMLTPRVEAEYWKAPMLFAEDMDAYRAVLAAALDLLPLRLEAARRELADKRQNLRR